MGRAAELTTLRSALSAAAARRGGFLLLAGEAGIGKTALLSEAARFAAADGARVLWGRCWDGDGATGLLAMDPGAARVRCRTRRRGPPHR